MNKLIMILFLSIGLMGCEELTQDRDGAPIGDDPSLTNRIISVWADFDVNGCCGRIAQYEGLMTLPHELFVRDLPEDEEYRYLQVEVLDYDRGIQVASVCYESVRGDQNFYYSHTLLHYGDCEDDVSWTKDLSTLNFRIEKTDTIKITGHGDFRGVREQFDFNVSAINQ